MKFHFEHLGPIKKGSVELGDLTIICGRNSVGKTYVSHSIWGLLNQNKFDLRHFKNSVVDLTINSEIIGAFKSSFSASTESASVEVTIALNDLNVSLNLNAFLEKFSKEGLQKTFNTEPNFFSNTKISLELFEEFKNKGKLQIPLSENKELRSDIFKASVSNKMAIPDVIDIEIYKEVNSDKFIIKYVIYDYNIFSESTEITPLSFIPSMLHDWVSSFIFPKTKIITSERTGIALFLPSLDQKASEIARKFPRSISGNNLKQYLISQKKEIGSYPIYADPIQDNIDKIRASSSNKGTSELINKHPELLDILNDFIGGEFNSTAKGITFTTSDNKLIPLHVVSSSAKSLFLIENYIKKEAQIGDLLIIDEPELNLHLDNQVKMARLIASLINSGIKVLITTHSDHLIREINNLIMLSSSKLNAETRSKLIDGHQYLEESILDKDKVKAFVVSKTNREIFEMEVGEYGVSMKLFNDEININNKNTKDIYYSLLESGDD
ncbi:TPA: AAA family ATPase [Photobacterium damselae]